MWTLVYQDVFLSGIGDEGERIPIPAFSFEIGEASQINIEIISGTAEQAWWQAGWLNQSIRDISLPTFEALAYWRRLPLGQSLFPLEAAISSRIIIEPRYWIRDISIRAWVKIREDNPDLPGVIFDGGQI